MSAGRPKGGGGRAGLTFREVEALGAVVEGRSLAGAAAALGVSRQRIHQLFWRACEKWPGVAAALFRQWRWEHRFLMREKSRRRSL